MLTHCAREYLNELIKFNVLEIWGDSLVGKLFNDCVFVLIYFYNYIMVPNSINESGFCGAFECIHKFSNAPEFKRGLGWEDGSLGKGFDYEHKNMIMSP